MTAIVFVQIGNPLTDFARENIKRTATEFFKFQVFLVVDQKVFSNLTQDIHDQRNLTIYVTDEAGQNSPIDQYKKSFRQGFWYFTKMRLYALGEFHRANPDISILHIENDVLLLEAFEECSLRSIKKVSWLSHTQNQDSGAVFFSPNVESTKNFVVRFFKEIEEDDLLTDMRVLHILRLKFPTEFGLLPTLDSGVLENLIRPKAEFSADFCSGFDPAFLGIWMFGDDARNRLGFSKRFSFLGQGKNIYPELVEFDSKLNLLTYGNSVKQVKVYSIHIHSKKTGLLNDSWKASVKREMYAIKMGRSIHSFNYKILFEVLSDYKRRGKLHTLFLSIPILGKVLLKTKPIFWK